MHKQKKQLILSCFLIPRPGFEPGYLAPKANVLPLDDHGTRLSHAALLLHSFSFIVNDYWLEFIKNGYNSGEGGKKSFR